MQLRLLASSATCARCSKRATATRYAIGDTLFGVGAYPGREGQLDLVLWRERIRAVIAGDTLINLCNGLEIPTNWLRKASPSSRSRPD